jgi:hypothetical protein
MTKPTVIPQVLANTEVKPQLDLTLNKNDLLDMIIGEREEQLENEIKAKDQQLSALHDELKQVADKHDKAVKKAAASAIKDKIKLAEKLFGTPAEVIMMMASTREGCYSNGISVRVSIGGEQQAYKPHWIGTYSLPDVELQAMPTRHDLLSLFGKIMVAETELRDLNKEKHELTHMGRVAKARMIRSVLESSEQGQQVLSKLPSMMKAIKLLGPKSK